MKKYNVLIALIVIILQGKAIAGYESTQKAEAISRTGSASYDEAYLTSVKEDISRMENVDDAYITENQEQLDRRGLIDEARLTQAAERAAQQ